MENWKETILKYNPPFILGALIASTGVILYNTVTSSNQNLAEISSYFIAIVGILFIILGIRKDLKKYSKKAIPITLIGIIVTLLLDIYTENYALSMMSLVIIFIIPYIVVKANQKKEKGYATKNNNNRKKLS